MTTFIVGLVVCVLFWLPLAMLYAWALQTLWVWYIVPIFSSTPLSFGAALGVGLVVQFLTQSIPKMHSNRSMSDKALDFAGCIIRPFAAVGAGWIYLQLWPLS